MNLAENFTYGSGIALACIATDRKFVQFVLIEKEIESCEIAKLRICNFVKTQITL